MRVCNGNVMIVYNWTLKYGVYQGAVIFSVTEFSFWISFSYLSVL